jgi:hypothetical protein
MARLTIRADARLRARSQITIPGPIFDADGATEGDRFLVSVDPDDPDTIRLHRIRGSYAGALRDLYGDAADHLATERGTWAQG